MKRCGRILPRLQTEVNGAGRTWRLLGKGMLEIEATGSPVVLDPLQPVCPFLQGMDPAFKGKGFLFLELKGRTLPTEGEGCRTPLATPRRVARHSTRCARSSGWPITTGRRWRRKGGPVKAEMEQAIRTQLAASMAPLEGMLAEATVDGVAQPKLNQRYLWVAPEDGWKVGPAP